MTSLTKKNSFNRVLLEVISQEELKTFCRQMVKKYPELQWFDLSPDNRVVSDKVITLEHLMVISDKRKLGIGTRVMRDLCDFADRNGYLIQLSVADKSSGIGTTSSGRLHSFYRRFGFVNNSGRRKRFDLSIYTDMYRLPNAS